MQQLRIWGAVEKWLKAHLPDGWPHPTLGARFPWSELNEPPLVKLMWCSATWDRVEVRFDQQGSHTYWHHENNMHIPMRPRTDGGPSAAFRQLVLLYRRWEDPPWRSLEAEARAEALLAAGKIPQPEVGS